MAARVTGDEVEEIFDNPESLDLEPFITAANLVVTKKLGNQGLTTEHLREIERWLAAHFAAIRDPRTSRERIGDAEYFLQVGVVGTGLEVTDYGKQVLMLDTTGLMSDLNSKRRSAKFASI